MKYTNKEDIPLPLAIWLATDHYDHSTDPKTISATSLIKPIKQTILNSRLSETQRVSDIASLVKSQIGTAIHTAVEQAIINNAPEALQALGIPAKAATTLKINPINPDPEDTNLYLEQRVSKELSGYTISGQYDIVINGALCDIKSTSTYTYIAGNKDMDYALQGSIYKWLNPDKITENFMYIYFVFTDWTAAGYRSNPSKYPKSAILAHKIQLMDIYDTERYLESRIQLLTDNIDKEEPLLPPCTAKELWRSDTVWKYYKNPSKTVRSTKNFTTPDEAYAKLSSDGNIGIVKEIKGEVRACKYCNAFELCTQKDHYLADKSLRL